MTRDSSLSLAGDAKAQRGINALDNTGDLLAGMVPAKAFPHLVSLLKVGLLSRDDAGCFSPGPLGLELGLIALQRLSPMREAEPEIVTLAADSGMSVAAATLGPLGPTVIHLEESSQPQHISLRLGTVMSLVNTAIGRVFAAHIPQDVLIDLLQQENIRLAGAEPSGALKPSKNGPGTLRAEYRSRLAQIGEEQIDHAFDAPVPGIGTLAAPVFDHTGNIRLVIALIGSSGHFDRSVQGRNAQQLLAATRRLSWRLGWVDHH